MPVIRGRPSGTKLPDERRNALLRRLIAEREGKPSQNGPVIFEIPLDQPDKLDVMVVWDEWQDVRSEDRTFLIQEAYGEREPDALSLALGVTLKEAIEQGVLPYRVRMRSEPQPKFKFTEKRFRPAALSVGGLVGPDGAVELRFPTQAIAEEAAKQLEERLPGSRWVVSVADV